MIMLIEFDCCDGRFIETPVIAGRLARRVPGAPA
jgi:hypothetical protein